MNEMSNHFLGAPYREVCCDSHNDSFITLSQTGPPAVTHKIGSARSATSLFTQTLLCKASKSCKLSHTVSGPIYVV
jgi:hypothetical protein